MKQFKIKNINCDYEDRCLTIYSGESRIDLDLSGIISLYVILREVIGDIKKEGEE